MLEQLRARRYELNISQAELAARVNMSQSQISDLERGFGMPTLTTLDAIAKALSMKLTAVPDGHE